MNELPSLFFWKVELGCTSRESFKMQQVEDYFQGTGALCLLPCLRLSSSWRFYSLWPWTCLLAWWQLEHRLWKDSLKESQSLEIIMKIIWCALKGVRSTSWLTGLAAEVLHCLSAWPLCLSNNWEPRCHYPKNAFAQKRCVLFHFQRAYLAGVPTVCSVCALGRQQEGWGAVATQTLPGSRELSHEHA